MNTLKTQTSNIVTNIGSAEAYSGSSSIESYNDYELTAREKVIVA